MLADCKRSYHRNGIPLPIPRISMAAMTPDIITVAVTRHGHTVGLFIPVHRDRKIDTAAYAEAARKASRLLTELGMTEDEAVTEFESLWRTEKPLAGAQ